jgi:hypothetical protein
VRRRGGGLPADDVVQFAPDHIVVNIELMQYLGGNIVIVTKQGQQEMFCSNDIGFVQLGLEVGDLQHLFGLFGERDVADGQCPA